MSAQDKLLRQYFKKNRKMLKEVGNWDEYGDFETDMFGYFFEPFEGDAESAVGELYELLAECKPDVFMENVEEAVAAIKESNDPDAESDED